MLTDKEGEMVPESDTEGLMLGESEAVGEEDLEAEEEADPVAVTEEEALAEAVSVPEAEGEAEGLELSFLLMEIGPISNLLFSSAMNRYSTSKATVAVKLQGAKSV